MRLNPLTAGIFTSMPGAPMQGLRPLQRFDLQMFAICWRARSRLCQNEILQGNMRLTAFFKFYKMYIFLHHCNLKILAKNLFEKSAIFVKIQQHFCKCGFDMPQNLQNFANFQNNQLDNLVDFEKCYKTRIYLQRSAPIQPKTSEICRIFAKKLATDP